MTQPVPAALLSLLEHLPHAAFLVTREGDLVASNDRGAPLIETLPGDWRESPVGQLRWIGPDDEEVWFDWTASSWEADGVGGTLVVCVDVTRTVLNEQRLRDQEALFEAFFEQSPIGMNLCREDGLWIRSNPAFLGIIGYTATEADGGLTYWDLTPRHYDEAEALQLAALEQTGAYGPYEKEFIRKDGTLVPVRLNGFFIQLDGQQYIWSLIEDIRTQRGLEERLQHERMIAIQSSKLATIGEMAAGFAHEVNNPLAVIEGYAYLLPEMVQRGDPSAVDEAIASIRDSVERAAHIVRGLRHLARRESDSTTVEDVDARAKDALDLCRARLRNHGVDLRSDLSSEGWAAVHGIELVQVVLNLVNNAFDAVVEHEERWVSVQTQADDTSVRIIVEDSGPPLPEAVRARLYEPFFTTKPDGSGTGLGLSISRTIVMTMDGTLELEEGPRTRFVVRLPRVPRP